jgi:heme-degrading monooxygenase HmoA
MSVHEIVRTTAVEGKQKELRRALEGMVKRFPQQEGCISAKALQAVESEDPNVFFLVIEWVSVDAHLQWRDSKSEGRLWFIENVRPFMSGQNLTGHYIQYAEA